MKYAPHTAHNPKFEKDWFIQTIVEEKSHENNVKIMNTTLHGEVYSVRHSCLGVWKCIEYILLSNLCLQNIGRICRILDIHRILSDNHSLIIAAVIFKSITISYNDMIDNLLWFVNNTFGKHARSSWASMYIFEIFNYTLYLVMNIKL